MSANIEMSGRGNEEISASEVGETKTLRGDATGMTRREKSGYHCLHPRWTLPQYSRECGG